MNMTESQSADALSLPPEVRRFSELLVDGSGCYKAIEMLAELPSIRVAYLIATAVTHAERIAGLDDLAYLVSALEDQECVENKIAR